MKKLILGGFSLFMAVFAFAQPKLTNAHLYMESYNKGEGGSNLEEAIKNIDIAADDEATSGLNKTWWYRAQIYQLASSDSTFDAKYPNASLQALKSFQKMKEINDPKFKDWDDAIQNMKALTSNLFNDGVKNYQKKKYHDGYMCFMAVSDLSDLIVAKGGKVNADVLAEALGNAALCAENDNDYANAIAAYRKLLPNAKNSKPYLSLISLYRKQKDTDNAKKTLEEALVKYPTDKELLRQKINFFIADGKYTEAISFLKAAVDQDPTNEQYQALLGVAYEQTNDTVNAKKVYQNLLVINPANFDANYGLGSMLANKAKDVQTAMNAINGLTKEENEKYEALRKVRNAMFTDASAYLNRALDFKKANPKLQNVEPTQAYIQSVIDRMALLLKQ